MTRRLIATLIPALAGASLTVSAWAQPEPTEPPAPKAAPTAQAKAPKAAPTAKAKAPKAAPTAKAKAPEGKAPGGGAQEGGDEALPPGHPPTGAPAAPQGPQGAMPPGHPPTAGGQGRGGGFNTPQDRVVVAQDLPAGVVDVQIVDGDEQPVPKAPITLTILRNSVTEGESTSMVSGTADEEGRYHFTGLPWGTGISYRLTTARDQATFTSSAFGLKKNSGVRALLHSYEPVTDLADAAMVMEAVVLLDIKQDSIAVNHLLRTLNVGSKAYVATNLRMPLPEDAVAFNKGDDMSTVAMVESDGFMEMVGTFPPGEAEMTYRYNLPKGSGDEARLAIPLPPRVVATRVVVGAGPKMGLEVAGFPKATSGRWQDGKRVLQTTKQANARAGLASLMKSTTPQTLDIRLTGLPSSGPAPTLALLLAIAAALGGLAYLFTHRNEQVLASDQREDLEEARDALLDEFALLERSRRRGDIGPRSYERLRAALLDALARIVNRLEMSEAEARRLGAPRSEGQGGEDSGGTKKTAGASSKRRKKSGKRKETAKARG